MSIRDTLSQQSIRKNIPAALLIFLFSITSLYSAQLPEKTLVKIHYIEGDFISQEDKREFYEAARYMEEVINSKFFQDSVRKLTFTYPFRTFDQDKKYSTDEIIDLLLLGEEPHHFRTNSVPPEDIKSGVIDIAIRVMDRAKSILKDDPASAYAMSGYLEITYFKKPNDGPDDPKYIADVLIHEYMHVLGFSHEDDEREGDVAYSVDRVFSDYATNEFIKSIPSLLAQTPQYFGRWNIFRSKKHTDSDETEETIYNPWESDDTYHIEITKDAFLQLYVNNEMTFRERIIYFTDMDDHLIVGGKKYDGISIYDPEVPTNYVSHMYEFPFRIFKPGSRDYCVSYLEKVGD